MKSNKNITIKRLTVDETNPNIKKWQEVGTEDVFIMPLSDEMVAVAHEQGIFGQSYQIFAKPDSAIKQTDRLIIDDETFEVKGIKKYEGSYNANHCEILVEKK